MTRKLDTNLPEIFVSVIEKKSLPQAVMFTERRCMQQPGR
jgi:hypothetical protein